MVVTTYNPHVRLLSPGPWLVGTTKVYPGVGADIVMESISLIWPCAGHLSAIAWLRQLRTGITCVESLTGVAKLGRMVFLFYRRQQGLSLENQFGRCLIL